MGVRLGVVRVVGNNKDESKGKVAHAAAIPEDRLPPPPPSNATPPDAQWQPVGGTRLFFVSFMKFYDSLKKSFHIWK